jgi:two-component system, OmpR family, response regulator ChvI
MQDMWLTSSVHEMTSMRGGSNALHVVIIDDDDRSREALSLNLSDEGYDVTSLSSDEALEYFDSGGGADVVLLDWRMSGIGSGDLLRSLRRAGNTAPVTFLTVLSEDIAEEAPSEGGTPDFVDELRRLSILVKRRRRIAGGRLPTSDAESRRSADVLHLGRLELRFDINRATWSGRPIDLTLTEFKIVALLARRSGEDVSYREIYDLVHGKDFVAGYGDEGYRPNVRTFIKRIRKKFRAVDPEHEHIQNYAGFGYRYHRAPLPALPER